MRQVSSTCVGILAFFCLCINVGEALAIQKKILFTGAYADSTTSSNAGLTRELEAFRSGAPLAVCEHGLKKGHFKTTKIGCTNVGCDGCKPGPCLAGRDQLVHYQISSDCNADVFFLGFDELKEGPTKRLSFAPVDKDYPQKGSLIEFGARKLKIMALSKEAEGSGGFGGIQIFEGNRRLAAPYSFPDGDFDCALKWAGDINGDGQPDMVLRCNQRIYEHVGVLLLSVPKKADQYEAFTAPLPELAD